MLEQDAKPKVPQIEIQQNTSNETDNPLRFTPSKRIFFQDNIWKTGSHKEKDVSCLKSNSKILKKKRHKDKFKFFKLDKHLFDPIQCHLGKSGKASKKKDKLAAIVQASGSKIPVREKTSWAGNTSQIWLFPQPKPLEYTFDFLSSTASNELYPIMMEEEDKVNKPLVDDFLTMSSYSPVPTGAAKNKLLMGDLIDLGTPNRFDSKVHHETSDSKSQLSSLNPLLITPKKPSLGNAAMQSCVISELSSLLLESVELKEQTESSVELILLDNSETAQEKSNVTMDYQCEKRNVEGSQLPQNSESANEIVSSPIVFYGFPCLPPPTDKSEKQPMSISTQLKSGRSRQMLVDHLNDDPYPKIVRESAKVRVRRRAFSMNDTLLAGLPYEPSEKTINPADCPFKAANVEGISNTEGPCTQTVESISSQKSSERTEDKADSTLEGGSDIVTPSNSQERCSIPDEIVPGNVCTNLNDSNLELNSDSDINGTKGLSSHSVLLATEDHSISKESSGIALSELSDVTVSEKDWNSSILGNSIESPQVTNEIVANEIKASEEVNEPNLDSNVASNNRPMQQTEDQTSLVTDNLIGDEHSSTLEKTQCTKSSPTHKAGRSSHRPSILKLQFSLHQDTKTDFEKIMMRGPENADQESPNITSKMGLVAAGDHREMDGSGFGDILTKKSLDSTQPLVEEKEHKEYSSNTLEFHSTDTRKLTAGEDIDTNENTCLHSKMDRPVSQETSTTVGSGLCSPKNSSGPIEEPDAELEKYSNYTLLDISAREVDQKTGSKKSIENTAAQRAALTKEIATPTNVTSEHSVIDSSFSEESCVTPLNHWVLPPGKKFRRSLSIIRNLDEPPSGYSRRGRHYEKSVEEIIRLQGDNAEARTPVQSLCKRLSKRRSSWMRQITPPRVRRSTFMWSPVITDRGTLYETPRSRKSIYSTPMQQNLVNRMSIRTSPMLGSRRSMSPFKQDCAQESPIQYTFKDLILTICKQTEPCSFSDIISHDSYEGGCKIGEGVFGEVFSIRRDNEDTVLKIIPVEGQLLVNGEKQKTYQEVFSELVIAKELDELRYEGSHELNLTCGYAEIISTSLVQDSYPEALLRFWDAFDQTKGSDNENPKMFDKEQLFIVMEQSNGGKDLESYTFSSAKQSLSVFKQIALSLAVAEKSVEFEHRDLHWGNVLVSKTTEKHLFYTLNGTQYSVASNGVKCTIIDYTLSRIKYINQVPIFNDIGKDPEMFIATGDYQFDIYRFMKQDVEDDWSRFEPKTNARWLHYLLDKMLTKVKYQRKTAKVHKDSLKVLGEIYKWVEGCGSAYAVALRLAEMKH